MRAEKCGKTSGSRYADPRLKKKASAVAELLKELYPDARCSLEYNDDPWRLLVMARLSAQCTDERVNIVSRELFQAYPTALAMSGAPLEDVERLVRPCGLYRTKAKLILIQIIRIMLTYIRRLTKWLISVAQPGKTKLILRPSLYV